MAFLFVGLVSAGVEFVEDDGEYGKYVIDTWVPDWLGGKGTSEIKLIQNTDQCLIHCSFTLEGTNEQPVSLIDDVKFLNRNGEDVSNNLKEITFYLGKYEEVEKLNYSKPIYSTEEVCNEPNLNETNSSNFTESCYYPVVDYETYNVDELVWTEYNGEKVEGYFQLKAEAKKEKISMDWIVEFRGKELSEWEWWNSDWVYKRQINLTADVGEFSYLATIDYDSNMNSDFSDLRFINNAEDTEFNYTIQDYTSSSSAVVRIYSQGETSFYMYYGNPLATTTSSASNTHFNPIAGYYLDGNANDFMNSYNGTVNGASLTTGKIGQGYNLDDGTDYVNLDSLSNIFSGRNVFSAGLWFKTSATSAEFISSRRTTGSFSFSNVMYIGDGKIKYDRQDGSSSTQSISSTSSSYNNNFWHFAVMVYNGTHMFLYVNGELIGTEANTFSITSTRTRLGSNYLQQNNDVLVDELFIYNRSLTPEETSALYNYTAPTYTIGEEKSNKGFITIGYVTPPTPENNSNLSVNYIPVEVEINYINATLDNITYDFYKGGELNQSYFFTNETLFVNHTGCQCDNWAFNVTACYTEQINDNSSCTTTETRYLIIDSQPPVINITSPLTNYDYLYENYTLDLNWTVNDTNLDSCWYSYNQTNTSVTCNDNTTTFNYIPNINNLTLYANDTFGNLGSEFRGWNVNIIELNKTYNNLTYDTADEYFYYYLNYNSSLINPTIILNYEGVNYTSINLGTGDFGVFRSKITIPVVNSTNNNTFKWIIKDNGNTEESINFTQTVNPIILTLCNATYSNKVLNFTYFDESNTLPIDASLNSTNINSYFKYWIGDGSVIKEYNYERLNAPTNNYTFCTSPYNNSNFTIKSDLELEYSASGYSEREYYFIEKELFNSSETISLYLLKDTLGTKFFHYVRQEIESVPNVLVEIQKFFISTGTFQKIGLKKTDNEGRFVEWLEQDKRYKYIITTAENVNLSEIEKTAICAVTPCEITLQIEEVTLDLFRELEAYFAENVDYNLTYNKTTGYITLNFLDETGTATYWRLNVYKSNFRNESIETICNKFAYSSAGTLDCDISGTMGEITAKVYISRSPEKLVNFLLVVNETITPAVGSSGLLASIIILLIIIFTGSRNPSNALIMMPFGLIILKLIGFMPLTWGWIVGITVFILLIMSRMKT